MQKINGLDKPVPHPISSVITAMPLDTGPILKQIDELLREFERARAAAKYDDFSGGLPDHELIAIATRFRAAIRRLSASDSEYVRRASEVEGRATPSYAVRYLGGILQALRADIDAGYSQSIEELIHAELFDDFLEMAKELLAKKYVGPAAVVAGSVLEEHLRRLADKHGVSRADAKGRPKSVDLLSVELRDARAFLEIRRKAIQSWYAQRTAGAHGNAGTLVESEVARMIDAVRDFVADHPA